MRFTLTGLLCPILSVFLCSPAVAADLVRLEQPFVTVGDVVQVSMPVTDALTEMLSLPLFRLEAGVERSFSNETLEASLVRRVPGLKGRLNVMNIEAQTFVYVEPEIEQVSRCLRLKKNVSEGDPILRQDTYLSASCVRSDQSVVSYNNSLERYEASQVLSAGTQIPITTTAVLPVAAKGDEMMLESQVGPVTVRRPVTLTESVFVSGLTHVRTSDGAVVNANLDFEGE